jgi:hypothetical protein
MIVMMERLLMIEIEMEMDWIETKRIEMIWMMGWMRSEWQTWWWSTARLRWIITCV